MSATHFAYPNSNVYPLESVTGQATKFCGLLMFIWGAPDSKMLDKAINDALSKQPESNLLIDAQTDSKTQLFLLFSLCQIRVTGTAARMEVGEQDIGQDRSGGGGTPAPTPERSDVRPLQPVAPRPPGPAPLLDESHARPSPEAALLAKSGVDYFQGARYDMALINFDKVIRSAGTNDPSLWKSLLFGGLAHARMGNCPKAIEYMDALLANPDAAAVYGETAREHLAGFGKTCG